MDVLKNIFTSNMAKNEEGLIDGTRQIFKLFTAKIPNQ